MSSLERIGLCIMHKDHAGDVVMSVSAKGGFVVLGAGSSSRTYLTPDEARAFRQGLSAAIRKAEEPTT